MDKERLKQTYDKYSKYQPAAFFIAGFLFDIITLGRIDDPLSILQQTLYLVIIGRMLFYTNLEKAGLWVPPKWIAKVWHYENEALHFLLGSLLSSYTLFYFVSASISTSLIFMIFIGGILIANELPQFQRQSAAIKYGIYYLCLFSFLSFLTPIILQFVSLITLLIAMLLTLLVAWTTRNTSIKKGLDKKHVERLQVYPAVTVCASILILYFLKVLPPIPLSVQYLGVYHKVERSGDAYSLSYDRPFWKIWQNGAQTFLAQPGDKLNVFARIFSPTNMDDQVIFRWQNYVNDEWQTTDIIKMRVIGGRSEGFRSHAFKTNYQAGDWRVKVETLDGREMGRIDFTVEIVTPSERELKTDLQ